MNAVIESFFNQPWALRRNYFESILNTFNGKHAQFPIMGIPADRNSKSINNEIAIIKLRGILSKKSDFFSMLFGGTNIEYAMEQFRTALADASMRAILLDIDSPGGDVNGAPEFSELIYNSRGQKPIIAYIGYDGSSAAYWIGAASDVIIAQQAAAVGSIGVIAMLWNGKKPEEQITVFSSMSPLKDIDLNSDEGIARIQKSVDSMANIFIENLALYRGVTTEKVISDFGRGDVLIAKDALAAGMIDFIGNFDMAVKLAMEKNIKIRSMTMPDKVKKIVAQDMVNPEEIDRKWLEENKPDLVDEIKQDQAQGETVNTDEINLEWLQKNKPDLIDEIKNSSQDEERDRIKEVDEEEKNSDDTSAEAKAIWKSAKFEKPRTAAEALREVHALSVEKRRKMRDERHDDASKIPPVKINNDNNSQAVALEQRKAAYREGIRKFRGR